MGKGRPRPAPGPSRAPAPAPAPARGPAVPKPSSSPRPGWGRVTDPERRILIVEDEEDIRAVLKELLESGLDRVRVDTAGTGMEALRKIPTFRPDVIISDYKMPGMTGLDFLEASRAVAPDTPKVLMTAFGDLDIAVKAINDAHIENFFQKPLNPEAVLQKVDRILQMQEARREKEHALSRSLEALKERLADVERSGDR